MSLLASATPPGHPSAPAFPPGKRPRQTVSALSLPLRSLVVAQDSEGRFCLNDLHRAAGSDPNSRPPAWTCLHSTQTRMHQLSRKLSFLPLVTFRGRAAGTFAVKELARMYAEWLNPEFALAVSHALEASAQESRQHQAEVQTLLDQAFRPPQSTAAAPQALSASLFDHILATQDTVPSRLVRQFLDAQHPGGRQ